MRARQRPRLRQVPRAFAAADRGERWMFALWVGLGLLLLFGAATAWPDGWDGAQSRFNGVPGTLTPDHCARSMGKGGTSWVCTGDFTGGGLHLPALDAVVRSPARPDHTLTGRVSGAGARTMWVDGQIEWIAAILLVLAAPFLFWGLCRWALDSLKPLGGWPKPAKPVRDPTVPPKLGNRARRRIRKRARRAPESVG